MKKPHSLSALGAPALLLASGLFANPAGAQAPVEYRVTRHGADSSHVRALERLGVKASLAQDGGLRYVDTARFLAAPTRDLGPGPDSEDGPTRLLSVDFAPLANLKALDDSAAIARVAQALKDAGVDVTGLTPYAFKSTLDLYDGANRRTIPLDTTVNHRFTLGSIPLVGPGAKMRFALAPGGILTHAHVTARQLAPGPAAKLLNPQDLRKIESERFGPNAKLQSRTVYYAPPMEFKAQRIVPHRLYTGSVSIGGQSVQIRPTLVPIVADAPRATLTVNQEGSRYTAKVQVTGGRAPYQFSFNPPPSQAQTSGPNANFTFEPAQREGQREQTATVTVTDADGLVSVATTRLAATRQTASRALLRIVSPLAPLQDDTVGFRGHTIGIHAIGATYSSPLGSTLANADGLKDRARAASVRTAFHWREGLAFERDWKSPAFRGNADRWFDQVDLGFFTGHAGGGGWLYSTSQDDGLAGTNEVRLGTRDAEWAIIAACGPLQSSADRQNQGVFEGLHILAGYASNSFDTDREGRVFADLVFHKTTILWLTIRDYQPIRTAWVNTAIEIQPAEESPGVPIQVAAMGVQRSSDRVSSWDDRFHGFGPVSPDIPASTRRTFWIVRTGT